MRDTSLEAYESLEKTQTARLCKRILTLLSVTPMTDEEILEALGGTQYYSDSGARARRSELVKQGLVMDSGKRGKTIRGKSCIVWAVAEDYSQQDLF